MQNITLHYHIGTEVEVKLTVKPINNLFPTTNLKDGLGCLKYRGKAKSLEEIEQGIIEATKQKWFNENKK